MWIIAYGSLTDGHIFVGPFKTFDHARDYAEEDHQAEWNVIELAHPADFDTCKILTASRTVPKKKKK